MDGHSHPCFLVEYQCVVLGDHHDGIDWQSVCHGGGDGEEHDGGEDDAESGEGDEDGGVGGAGDGDQDGDDLHDHSPWANSGTWTSMSES